MNWWCRNLCACTTCLIDCGCLPVLAHHPPFPAARLYTTPLQGHQSMERTPRQRDFAVLLMFLFFCFCCCCCCCCCCCAGVVWCLELIMFSCLCCSHVFFAKRRVRGEWNLVPSPGWLRLGSGTTRRGTSRDWGWGSWGPLGVDSTWQPVWPMISVLQSHQEAPR